MAASAWAWIGATASATTVGANISPPYPASGVVAGDVITCLAANKASSGSGDPPTLATPAGWSVVVTAAGGPVVTVGAGVGKTRLTLFKKDADADGSENGTTLTNLLQVPTGGEITYVTLQGFRRATAGSTLLIAASTGNDTTTGTAFSAVMAADVGVQTDDLLIGIATTPASTSNSASGETISQPGCTIGAVSEPGGGVTDNGTTSGFDIRQTLWTGACTAGTSSGVATITATYGATAQGCGPGALVRIREQVTAAAAKPPLVVSQYSGRW